MPTVLERIKDEEKRIQATIESKMKNGEHLTDAEASLYKLKPEDVELMDCFKKIANGQEVPGFSFKDFLATPQASVLIPKVIIGTMRKAAEPLYLASQFYKKIRLKQGNATMFPSIGVMKAHDVAEGQEIPQESIDWQLHKSSLIKVGKSGVRVQVTEDLMQDAEWDIVGMLLQEAGRAMARHKEQKAFTEWLMHGWKLFDNALYRSNPTQYANARTTGVDYNAQLNDTISIDDFLDLIICVYNNEYVATDLVMHPLAWTVFAKNGLTGSLSAPQEMDGKRDPVNGSFKIGPEAIQGKIPFALNVNLSPFCPIDKDNRTFDIFCVDRNNVGVLIVKDDLKTEQFRDPSRDILNTKIIERYGYGTYNEGRAIVSAQNISMAKSWPLPERSIIISQN